MKHRKTLPPLLSESADLGPDIRRVPILAADRVTIIRDATAEDAEWTDPDDLNPQRRKARKIQGARAADPLQAMAQRGTLITERHLKAARKLTDDYERGVLGARPSAATGGQTKAGFSAAQYPEEARLACLTNVRHAQAAVGATGWLILSHVVLGIPDPANRTVRAYAARHGMHEQAAAGLLFGAIERLAEYYSPTPRSEIVEANEQASAAG